MTLSTAVSHDQFDSESFERAYAFFPDNEEVCEILHKAHMCLHASEGGFLPKAEGTTYLQEAFAQILAPRIGKALDRWAEIHASDDVPTAMAEVLRRRAEVSIGKVSLFFGKNDLLFQVTVQLDIGERKDIAAVHLMNGDDGFAWPHNHRYSMHSLILENSYDEKCYPWNAATGTYECFSRKLVAGDINIIDGDRDFHYVYNAQNVLTLVIYNAAGISTKLDAQYLNLTKGKIEVPAEYFY